MNTSTKEYAVNVFNSLTENQILDFMRLFADDNTLARFESDLIASGFETKRYNSFKEILQELDEEEDDE